MPFTTRTLVLLSLLGGWLVAPESVVAAAPGAAAGQESLPRVVATIPLPDVEGRIGEGDSGALAAIDLETGRLVFEIALDGHPESFQLEASGPRVFVNVPRRQEVEVVHRAEQETADRWRLPCAANFPMALDEGRGRLFVGCRRPAKLLVLDAGTGSVLAELDAPGDADDVFLDPELDRVYVSGGEGLVRVYARSETEGTDGLTVVGDVATGAGARTSLFARDSGRLYVAVPRRDSSSAEVLVLETSPR